MFTFKAEQWVPQFILNDKNGYALAKAIEAAVQYMNDRVQQGFDCLTNVGKMPEWRLDEMAWEFDLLYDYNAEIATKRDWITNAVQFYKLYGTAGGIIKYLEAVFDNVDLEEWFEYGGDPFHFRVTVSGEWSDEVDDWTKKAVARVQNVRSVLDTIIFNSGGAKIPLYVATAVCGIEITDEVQIL